MNARRRKITIVPLIPFPKEYRDRLKDLVPKVLASIQEHGVDVSKGTFPIDGLTPALDEALFYVRWVGSTNEVFEAMNLVLVDLKVLPKQYALLEGSPKARYYLLVRTFFHEFYRLREVFASTVKEAESRKYIPRGEAKALRQAFHGIFEHVVALRNALVHQHVTWTGREHYDLELVLSAWEQRRRVVRKDTGIEFSVEEALDKACSVAAIRLGQHGKDASKLMKAFVKDFVALTNEA